jgi:hypothetical protein
MVRERGEACHWSRPAAELSTLKERETDARHEAARPVGEDEGRVAARGKMKSSAASVGVFCNRDAAAQEEEE